MDGVTGGFMTYWLTGWLGDWLTDWLDGRLSRTFYPWVTTSRYHHYHHHLATYASNIELLLPPFHHYHYHLTSSHHFSLFPLPLPDISFISISLYTNHFPTNTFTTTTIPLPPHHYSVLLSPPHTSLSTTITTTSPPRLLQLPNLYLLNHKKYINDSHTVIIIHCPNSSEVCTSVEFPVVQLLHFKIIAKWVLTLAWH